jgi:dTDP-4-dehydrorhamnose 3,5-epimerase
MNAESTALEGVWVLQPRRFEDNRGAFRETFKAVNWSPPNPVAGIETVFVQDNQCISWKAGTLRGFHFQRHPFAQAKLVRVLTGSVQDVVVDLREGSPTYGVAYSIILSAENETQLFVPKGFAHTYLTLEDNTEVLYKVDAPYHPESEGGLRWDSPGLDVEWALPHERIILSDKDKRWPTLRELEPLHA